MKNKKEILTLIISILVISIVLLLMPVRALDKWDLSALSDKKIPYGCSGKNVDSNNIPYDAVNCQEKYGKYDAVFIKDTCNKKIYLTFDEGYEAGFTPEILDVLKKNNVSAVFFITKQFFDSNPELIQRMIDEGHIVGNHTCRHPAGGMPTLSISEAAEDIKKLHQLVLDKFNYNMTLFRFPEGVYSEQMLGLISNLDYKSVFWSFAYKDFDINNQPEKAAALNKLISRLHPGAIYLLHAVSATNTAILDEFINEAEKLGFEFGVYE